jgi:deoxycytidylate deaminase
MSVSKSDVQTMASLVSRRSNCMKRRVGAVLVRENRVLASGYESLDDIGPIDDNR